MTNKTINNKIRIDKHKANQNKMQVKKSTSIRNNKTPKPQNPYLIKLNYKIKITIIKMILSIKFLILNENNQPDHG